MKYNLVVVIKRMGKDKDLNYYFNSKMVINSTILSQLRNLCFSDLTLRIEFFPCFLKIQKIILS